MCESNFRRALLEQPFRVWHSGSVGEYDVTLTPVSVILRPRTPGKGGGAAAAAAAASCCSRICSRTRSAKIEVFGRDLLSCRPAHGATTDTKVGKRSLLCVSAFRFRASWDTIQSDTVRYDMITNKIVNTTITNKTGISSSKWDRRFSCSSPTLRCRGAPTRPK